MPLILVSATSYFPEQARVLMRQFSIDTLTEEEWQILRQRHLNSDKQIRAIYEQGQAFAISYDDMNFSKKSLSKISARTLIVQGDRDPLFQLKCIKQFLKAAFGLFQMQDMFLSLAI